MISLDPLREVLAPTVYDILLQLPHLQWHSLPCELQFWPQIFFKGFFYLTPFKQHIIIASPITLKFVLPLVEHLLSLKVVALPI